MADLPATWAAMHGRLARILGVGSEQDVAAADEWTRQALQAVWGVEWPHELPRERRGLGLQRMSGVLLALEDAPVDLAFHVGARAVTAAAFARYWDGVALDGPPWRLDPTEQDRPAYRQWADSASFEGAA